MRYLQREDIDRVQMKTISTGRKLPFIFFEKHVKETEMERTILEGLKLARGEHKRREIGSGGGSKNVETSTNRV